LGFAARECVVLWQGILRQYKGISFLLQAWRQVCAAKRPARLAIVGTGNAEMVRAVENEVRTLGLESKVRLDLRFVSIEELADFYSAADVLVYPYSDITSSGALMAGIAQGKAIVASALPAFQQVLEHEQTALLVPCGDVDQLAASLIRLITDEALRSRLSDRLRALQDPPAHWLEIGTRTAQAYWATLTDGAEHASNRAHGATAKA
jgi:glycosyltransferase involved in cell wall biosynthesis